MTTGGLDLCFIKLMDRQTALAIECAQNLLWQRDPVINANEWIRHHLGTSARSSRPFMLN